MAITATQLYQKLEVPEYLQQHMLRAAAIGALITDNWSGPVVDRDKIIRVLLAHDLGNMVKMTSHIDPNVQKKYRERFGNDDQRASAILARETGLSADEVQLIVDHEFAQSEITMNSGDFERKICAYADLRVAPDGVLSLIDRLNEGKQRYQVLDNTDFWIECAVKIERQIFQYCSLAPEEINDRSIAGYVGPLKRFSIA